MNKTPGRRFRDLIERDRVTLLPAVGDPFSARIVAMEGYEAVGASGNATAAMRLGIPDLGLLTLMENVETAGRIADASGLPVFADADTGYGNPLNVRRTVHEFERAGVGAVMIEDQVSPKRCGMLKGKQLIPAVDMEAKIKAAVDARLDDAFVIVGRTDARSVEGLDAAIRRAERYATAGADAIFVEGSRSEDEAAEIGRRVGRPLLYNVTPTGSTPDLDPEALARMGFRLLSFSVFVLLAAIPAMRGFLREVRAAGRVGAAAARVAPFSEYLDILGYEAWRRYEERYAVPADEAGVPNAGDGGRGWD